MMQRYQKAFSIFFKHDFFSDGKLKTFLIKPTAETERVLRNAGAMMVPFQDGIHILYDSLHNSTERSRTDFLKNEDNLRFLITNNDPNFFNYTAGLDTDISRSYLFFGNNSCAVTTGKEVLHSAPFVDKDDLRQTDPKDNISFIKPFGMIDIRMHKDLESSLEISFNSYSTYWCYVLSTDHLQKLVNPAIVNKKTKEAFTGPELIRLSETQTAPAFFSSKPIPYHERVKNMFQLVEEYNKETLSYKMVWPVLPGPNPKHISSLETTEAYKNKNLSFIFI